MSDSPDLVAHLQAVDLFASLSKRDLKQVSAMGRRVEHAPGHEVVAEGGGSAGFHLILTGEALVDVSGAARPSLGPGQYFGEISLLDGKPRTASVTAGPDGLVTHSITSWQFSGLLEKHPELVMPIITVLCARLRAAEASATQAQSAAVS